MLGSGGFFSLGGASWMGVREGESDRRPFWAGVGVYAMLGWRPQCDKTAGPC
jgi:hypothetical protein